MQSINELIELARREPGKLNYGSTGLGSGSHLSIELFMARTGIRMTHVPFRGAAPLLQELMGGRIDVSNSTLPDVPTLREQGIADADAESWAAFFAPAATPSTILDRLSREIIAVLEKPAAREAITKMGFSLKVREPAAFRPYLVEEIKTWGEIIKAAGVKAEG